LLELQNFVLDDAMRHCHEKHFFLLFDQVDNWFFDDSVLPILLPIIGDFQGLLDKFLLLAVVFRFGHELLVNFGLEILMNVFQRGKSQLCNVSTMFDWKQSSSPRSLNPQKLS
jgi:hypothetical protein